MTVSYRVDYLQTVEPDKLAPRDGIAVDVETMRDDMGLPRVSVTGPTREAVIDYVRSEWGDEDGGWFADFVVGRIWEVATPTGFRYRSPENLRRVGIGLAGIDLVGGMDDVESAAADLIADVLHAVRSSEEDFDQTQLLDRAERAYLDEVAGDREAVPLPAEEAGLYSEEEEISALRSLLSHDDDVLVLERRGDDSYGLIAAQEIAALRSLLLRLTRPTR